MKTPWLLTGNLLAAFTATLGDKSRDAIAIGAGHSVPIGQLRYKQTAGTDVDIGLLRGTE